MNWDARGAIGELIGAVASIFRRGMDGTNLDDDEAMQFTMTSGTQ